MVNCHFEPDPEVLFILIPMYSLLVMGLNGDCQQVADAWPYQGAAIAMLGESA